MSKGKFPIGRIGRQGIPWLTNYKRIEILSMHSSQEKNFLSMDEYRNDSPISPKKLYEFDSADMFDHSCSNS